MNDKEIYLLGKYEGKSYNLQFIRFIAAVMVIFSHSFHLATGDYSKEWLTVITNNQLDFGALAVAIFFLCGGYFATQTITRKKDSAVKKIYKRYIRLAKPLAFVVVMSIILGAFFSRYSFGKYLQDYRTWKYLLNILLLPVHNLPGVFENNVLFSTINGALWTLPVEFMCFIFCILAYELKLLNTRKYIFTIPIVVLGEVCIKVASSSIPLAGELIKPTILFYIGILYYIYKDKILLQRKYFLISILGIIVCDIVGVLFWGMIFFFPYLSMYIWFNKSQISDRLANCGNYSYAMYLWGYPVQQAIIHCYGGTMNSFLNFAIALPITIVLAILTHTFFEK